ncbi:NADH-quinone oxidoreductase subunit M [Buchnera aphidicola (Cinara cuneomaculata)]|uniref:NADH-quinone oxidoreductase subunit M n=1 Tax=Buchnera aphidicola (Cinara cuneomaculata) TaxID=1660040 RepID=A0A451CXW0_9GAMM|nr:NADH-quinone oxidoreductase subunit M [Buchnera aphidicola]VFP78095.1 NADH-quinone oxidoreductase subunit M [Buchnera aphidicola (Cinara cuneomaculata)]
MILLIFILVPLLGAILSVLTGFLNERIPRYIAIFSVMVCLLTVLLIYLKSNNNFLVNFTNHTLLVTFYKNWFPEYGISIYFGVDNLSLLMILLTSFIGLCSIYCEWNTLNNKIGIFYFFLLWIISGMFGIFLSLDMFLFFLFWELILIPMYFFIIFWNKKNKNFCDIISVFRKFFIHSQISGFFLLFFILNIVCIHYKNSGIWTFNYFILKNIKISVYTEFYLMFSLLLSFIIKIPLFPFHSWLPDVQACISPSGSVDLIGILLKPAIYGLLRFYLVFFARTSHILSLVFMCIGLFSMFYGSIMAFAQTNTKRFLAYSSISSMGVIFAAMHSENIIAYQGILLYIASYVVSTAALLIIFGKIFTHINTQNILYMSGLWSYMHIIPSFFLFFSLAMLNIPLTGNFSGEFMMLFGIFMHCPILGCFFIFGLFLSSIYFLRLIQQVCYGSNSLSIIKNELNFFDFIILLFFAFFIFFLGLYPKFILNFL